MPSFHPSPSHTIGRRLFRSNNLRPVTEGYVQPKLKTLRLRISVVLPLNRFKLSQSLFEPRSNRPDKPSTPGGGGTDRCDCKDVRSSSRPFRKNPHQAGTKERLNDDIPGQHGDPQIFASSLRTPPERSSQTIDPASANRLLSTPAGQIPVFFHFSAPVDGCRGETVDPAASPACHAAVDRQRDAYSVRENEPTGCARVGGVIGAVSDERRQRRDRANPWRGRGCPWVERMERDSPSLSLACLASRGIKMVQTRSAGAPMRRCPATPSASSRRSSCARATSLRMLLRAVVEFLPSSSQGEAARGSKNERNAEILFPRPRPGEVKVEGVVSSFAAAFAEAA